MDENAEIDIEALSDEVYIPLNLLPSIVRNLNSRLAALEHEHSAADITSGTLQAARIAEGSLPGSKIEEGTVTLDRFEKSVRDSLSHSKLLAANWQTQTLYWAHLSADKRIYIYTDKAGTQANRVGYVALN